jgi:hypothetical protein
MKYEGGRWRRRESEVRNRRLGRDGCDLRGTGTGREETCRDLEGTRGNLEGTCRAQVSTFPFRPSGFGPSARPCYGPARPAQTDLRSSAPSAVQPQALNNLPHGRNGFRQGPNPVAHPRVRPPHSPICRLIPHITLPKASRNTRFAPLLRHPHSPADMAIHQGEAKINS